MYIFVWNVRVRRGGARGGARGEAGNIGVSWDTNDCHRKELRREEY